MILGLTLVAFFAITFVLSVFFESDDNLDGP